MIIENGILESLIQDGRTIDLIYSYLAQCCNLELQLSVVKEYIINLYDKKLIQIEYPHQYKGLKSIDVRLWHEYWFGLTVSGELECIKRGLMSV